MPPHDEPQSNDHNLPYDHEAADEGMLATRTASAAAAAADSADTPVPVTRREEWGWYLYDAAVSAFYSVALPVFFPLLLNQLAADAAWQQAGQPRPPDCGVDGVAVNCAQCVPGEGMQLLTSSGYSPLPNPKVQMGAASMDPVAFATVTLGLSVVCQVAAFITLGPLADYGMGRMRLLQGGTAMGITACALCMALVSPSLWWLSGVLLITANVGYGLAIVAYYSYLPVLVDAAPPVLLAAQLAASAHAELSCAASLTAAAARVPGAVEAGKAAETEAGADRPAEREAEEATEKAPVQVGKEYEQAGMGEQELMGKQAWAAAEAHTHAGVESSGEAFVAVDSCARDSCRADKGDLYTPLLVARDQLQEKNHTHVTHRQESPVPASQRCSLNPPTPSSSLPHFFPPPPSLPTRRRIACHCQGWPVPASPPHHAPFHPPTPMLSPSSAPNPPPLPPGGESHVTDRGGLCQHRLHPRHAPLTPPFLCSPHLALHHCLPPSPQEENRMSLTGVACASIASILATLLSFAATLPVSSDSLKLRLALLACALWWLLLSLPTFLWLLPRPGPPFPPPPPLPSSSHSSACHRTASHLAARLASALSSAFSGWRHMGRLFSEARRYRSAFATLCTPLLFYLQRWMHPVLTNKAMVMLMLAGMLPLPLWELLGYLTSPQSIGLKAPWELFVFACWFGFFLGGLNAYSKTLFIDMIPVGREAAFFSLYSVSDKGSSWLGPFIVAIIVQITGELRPSFLYVFLVILIPLICLHFFVNHQQGIVDAAPSAASPGAPSASPAGEQAERAKGGLPCVMMQAMGPAVDRQAEWGRGDAGAEGGGDARDYVYQQTADTGRFWGVRHELALGTCFQPREGQVSPLGEVSPQEFEARVQYGFQVTPFLHLGTLKNQDDGSIVRWRYEVTPIDGWGPRGGTQLSTAGWLSALPAFEPHWQVCMAMGRASGWVEWQGHRVDFTDAVTYSEKNWGGAFPLKWFWIQCNVWSHVSLGSAVALTVAGAKRQLNLPLLANSVEEVGMVGLHWQGQFIEFVPNRGAVEWKVQPWGSWHMHAHNEQYEVTVEAHTLPGDNGTPLRAPTAEGMRFFCKDSFDGRVKLELRQRYSGQLLLRAESTAAAVEVGGGPWWEAWEQRSRMNPAQSAVISLPLNLSSLLPPSLQPPGL
ncbi:unnamed protein product [Closterium sp. Naga37s-1]|nr:unnamed protein product [Closterium sp. Naga37s-1]